MTKKPVFLKKKTQFSIYYKLSQDRHRWSILDGLSEIIPSRWRVLHVDRLQDVGRVRLAGVRVQVKLDRRGRSICHHSNMADGGTVGGAGRVEGRDEGPHEGGHCLEVGQPDGVRGRHGKHDVAAVVAGCDAQKIIIVFKNMENVKNMLASRGN